MFSNWIETPAQETWASGLQCGVHAHVFAWSYYRMLVRTATPAGPTKVCLQRGTRSMMTMLETIQKHLHASCSTLTQMHRWLHIMPALHNMATSW